MFDIIKRDWKIANLKFENNKLKNENKKLLVQKMDFDVFKSRVAKELREEIEMEYKHKEHEQYVANCNHIAVALAGNPSCPKSILYDIFKTINEPILKEPKSK